ncbi:MAG: VPLPA-CTERM sorting domain-containing protein [Pseudomonadota bacterium]
MRPTAGTEFVETLIEIATTDLTARDLSFGPERVPVDSFAIRVGVPEVIPLPAAGHLPIGGLGALALVRRHKG